MTEPNRYARLGPLGRALVDDYDQIALAAMLVKTQDELARAEAELQQHAEAESTDAAVGSYALRAEGVEAQLARVRRLHRPVGVVAAAEFGQAPDCAACRRAWPCQTYNAVTEDHAIAQHERWLHIAFTSPDETSANTSAHAIRDHLAAEFDGVSMRITTNAAEADPSCSPAAAETEPNNSRTTLDNPAAWTPPPPGDRREQLPDHILALLDIPLYTSTACESAELCAAAVTRHPEHADELRHWEQRQRQMCRINNKYTGVNCEHAKTEPAAPAAPTLNSAAANASRIEPEADPAGQPKEQ